MSKANGVLKDKLVRFRSDHPNVDMDVIADLVRTTVRTVNEDVASMRHALLDEVAELGRAVNVARDEIARLRREHELSENPIPDATDELDAIVQHTASATETILEACEEIDECASNLAPPDAERLQSQTIRIFEACSFQDITGQRISKVVAALKMIEARIARIVGTYVHNDAEMQGAADPLLNGPQAPHAAMAQAEIDRLLTF